MSEQYYSVGKIVNTHGIRGEVKILPHTDFPEERFAKGSVLYLFMTEQSDPIVLTVADARLHKKVYIVRFVSLSNINDVEHYKGAMLKVAAESRAPLPEDEYYYSDIIGCEVVSDEGEALGVITEILAPGANDVWVVSPNKGDELLIPVIDDVVLNVDIQAKRVKVHLMEGLR